MIALLDAPDRTMTVSDLSDALRKGPDSTWVQSAVTRLMAIGIVRRELRPADAHGGRAWTVMLTSDVQQSAMRPDLTSTDKLHFVDHR